MYFHKRQTRQETSVNGRLYCTACPTFPSSFWHFPDGLLIQQLTEVLLGRAYCNSWQTDIHIYQNLSLLKGQHFPHSSYTPLVSVSKMLSSHVQLVRFKLHSMPELKKLPNVDKRQWKPCTGCCSVCEGVRECVCVCEWVCARFYVCFAAAAAAAADPVQYAQRVADGNMIKVKAKTSSSSRNKSSQDESQDEERTCRCCCWPKERDGQCKNYAKAREKLFDVCAESEKSTGKK